MKFTVIIPARYASQRLPGKPLLDIAGKPMIQRVYESASQSAAERIVIATDDERIKNVCEKFGAEICLTSANHQSGTDRLQEVITKLKFSEEEIVVNVQGDEPLIPAAVINQVADNLFTHPLASCATLSEKVHDLDTCFNPNAVKVVCDNLGFALYFSRASIPWIRDEYRSTPITHFQAQRHIGIYAYKVELLNHFVQWPQSELEKLEKLEQLRILENGHKIHVQSACEAVPAGIDTQEDLAETIRLLQAGN